MSVLNRKRAVFILCGLLAVAGVGRFTDYQTVVAGNSIIPAPAVSASVVVVFGYYPARRAARLNRIQALR